MDQLLSLDFLEQKLKLLNEHPKVIAFLDKDPHFLKGFSLEEEVMAKQLIAIDQLEKVIEGGEKSFVSLQELLQKLLFVDHFYRELGGIVGYQKKVVHFLEKKEEKLSEIIAFHPPSFIDIQEETDLVRKAIVEALLALPEMVEFYPLGGAADRLHLVDEKTGNELPAAKLCYAGRSLLEGLIRDLVAREHLYFRLFGKRVITPIVIMTSQEKNNHQHVVSICESNDWFGRPKDSFKIFTQPLVPAVDHQGNWCLLGPYTPLLKPGGHGALWKRALDEKVFDWLYTQGRKKALIRQLNNPIAGTDYGLLAFFGIGVMQKMHFGFASCPRLVGSAEGVNLVVEKKNGEVALTNIEYCDFKKYGIEDVAISSDTPYSRFSSNTNILFADLEAIEKAVKLCPFPGLLINLKDVVYTTLGGEKKSTLMARLESTMQNIADVFVEKVEDFHRRQGRMEKTYVTYNKREKTIATAKKAFIREKSVRETPEECFYTQLQETKKVLKSCQFQVGRDYSLDEYLEKGPDLLFLYHPALGPLYSLIRQKLKRGKISLGSEVCLEISDLLIENLEVDGSFRIEADQVVGSFEKGILCYSHQAARVFLKNVRVQNQGIDWAQSFPFWKMGLQRKESLRIKLRGFSEFIAEDVLFQGDHFFEVPDGVSMRVYEKEGKVIVEKRAIEKRVFLDYQINERQEILAVRKI